MKGDYHMEKLNVSGICRRRNSNRTTENMRKIRTLYDLSANPDENRSELNRPMKGLAACFSAV